MSAYHDRRVAEGGPGMAQGAVGATGSSERMVCAMPAMVESPDSLKFIPEPGRGEPLRQLHLLVAPGH